MGKRSDPPEVRIRHETAWGGTPDSPKPGKLLVPEAPPPTNSTSENRNGEIFEGRFPYPLRRAIEKLGGPSVLLASTGLACTRVKLPREDAGIYVTGLQGRLPESIKIPTAKKTFTFARGTSWEIRWDYDTSSKGPHVNFKCGDGKDALKYAIGAEATLVSTLKPPGRIVEPDEHQPDYPQNILPNSKYSSDLYYEAIIDQSRIIDGNIEHQLLDYNIVSEKLWLEESFESKSLEQEAVEKKVLDGVDGKCLAEYWALKYEIMTERLAVNGAIQDG